MDENECNAKFEENNASVPGIKMAPTYHPTEKEFKDPFKYIHSIAADAERYGICKIIPPSSWNPSFSPDPDNFEFIPRNQQLNMLEARTRLAVVWIEKLKVYWKMYQPLELPTPKNKTKQVDFSILYKLNELLEGEKVPIEKLSFRKWKGIASALGFSPDAQSAKLLESIYKEFIEPMVRLCEIIDAEDSDENNNNNDSENKENVASSSNTVNTDTNNNNTGRGTKRKRRPSAKVVVQRKPKVGFGLFNDGKCESCDCELKLEEAKLPLISECGRCSQTYHVSCIKPKPKVDITKNWDWWCESCVHYNLKKKNCIPFGFADDEKEFSLLSFGDYASRFKTSHFKGVDADSVPEAEVETEFWKLVNSPNIDVKVKYGADLAADEYGSGFPSVYRICSFNDSFENKEQYETSGWNLNNFPTQRASLLRFVKGDLRGMKIPWVYVGMCFSAFCWHNEDHWTHSINYLHFGSTKTWYGIPGREAENFETRMRDEASELFEFQPNLLHDLVTLLDPAGLVKGPPKTRVNVFKVNQRAREFVVTFPRAYHAGFNQGFNFAEAVNFATASWLRPGLDSIGHYSEHNRKNVFSHEEMLCNMADDASSLEYDEAYEAHIQLLFILDEERRFKNELKALGVTKEKKLKLEVKQDDDRSCVFCNTTLYLSAVHCICRNGRGKLLCKQHLRKLCNCNFSKYEYCYRYKLHDLEDKVVSLMNRVAELRKPVRAED